jgi:hypothetical protein
LFKQPPNRFHIFRLISHIWIFHINPYPPFSVFPHITMQRLLFFTSLYMKSDFPFYLFVILIPSRYLIPLVIREYPKPLTLHLESFLCFISAKISLIARAITWWIPVIHLPKADLQKTRRRIPHVWLHFVQICFLSSKIKHLMSSPLYSVNFVLIFLSFNRSAKVNFEY